MRTTTSTSVVTRRTSGTAVIKTIYDTKISTSIHRVQQCSLFQWYACDKFSSTHSCQILSPSKTGIIVTVHRLPNITLLTLVQATLWFQGETLIYILNVDTYPVIRAIEVSHAACEDEDELRQNLRSHRWNSCIVFVL